RVGVTDPAGGGDEHMFAGLDVNAGVDPSFFACQLYFLGEALFALGRRHGRGVLHFLLDGDLLRRRRGVLAEELRAKGMRESCCDERTYKKRLQFCNGRSNHGNGPSRAGLGSISTVSRCPGRAQALSWPSNGPTWQRPRTMQRRSRPRRVRSRKGGIPWRTAPGACRWARCRSIVRGQRPLPDMPFRADNRDSGDTNIARSQVMTAAKGIRLQ